MIMLQVQCVTGNGIMQRPNLDSNLEPSNTIETLYRLSYPVTYEAGLLQMYCNDFIEPSFIIVPIDRYLNVGN